MEKDDTQNDSDFDVWKTTADIFGRHGKTDDEIKEMLEYHFPIGSVLLIGLCAPLSAAIIPTSPIRYASPSTAIEEPYQEDRHFDANQESGTSSENVGEDAIRADLRELIASSSIPILRSRGMTDEEIKKELLRDFDLTEEQVDRIIATH